MLFAPETESDRGGVDDNLVTDVDVADQLSECERPTVIVEQQTLQARSGSELLDDGQGVKRRHQGRSERRDELLDALVAALERILAQHCALRLIV